MVFQNEVNVKGLESAFILELAQLVKIITGLIYSENRLLTGSMAGSDFAIGETSTTAVKAYTRATGTQNGAPVLTTALVLTATSFTSDANSISFISFFKKL